MPRLYAPNLRDVAEHRKIAEAFKLIVNDDIGDLARELKTSPTRIRWAIDWLRSKDVFVAINDNFVCVNELEWPKLQALLSAM